MCRTYRINKILINKNVGNKSYNPIYHDCTNEKRMIIKDLDKPNNLMKNNNSLQIVINMNKNYKLNDVKCFFNDNNNNKLNYENKNNNIKIQIKKLNKIIDFSTNKHLNNKTAPKRGLKKNISLPLINSSKNIYENKFSCSNKNENKKNNECQSSLRGFSTKKDDEKNEIIFNTKIRKKYNYHRKLNLYNMAKLK